MDNKYELENIIAHIITMQEDTHLELKEASDKVPKNFWETYSSFANTSGGYIILGIKDSYPHTIIGLKNHHKLIQDIVNNANNKDKVNYNLLKEDSIKSHIINDKVILSIYVPELSITKKPLYLNNNLRHTYIRKNEGDFVATDEELRRFIRNSQDNTDAEFLENYTIEDLDTESILEFKNIIHIRNLSKNYLAMDNLEFLIEMGVFQIDRNDNRIPKLTLTGLLFLGKLSAIMQKLPHFHLDYINKRGNDSTRWKDRVSTGDSSFSNLNLFQYYKIVLEKLKLTIQDSFELDEKCVRKSSIELDVALREALTNMIIHADYLDAETSLTVIVDNFYYTFSNPGTMKIPRAQFFTGGQSNPRNTTLVLFFRRMGACERAGSGGKEIFNVILKNKFRCPELSTSLNNTYLKLWTATPEDSYPEFSNSTRTVLLYIQNNRMASKESIITNTQLSEYYVRKAINELIDKEIISVIGKGRATKYVWNPSTLEIIAAIDVLKNATTNKA